MTEENRALITLTPEEEILLNDNGQGLVDILPQSFKDAYARVPKDVKLMSDSDLITAMNRNSETSRKKKRIEDRRTDIRLKHAIWHEYDQAITENRGMMCKNIIQGIMHQHQLYPYLEDKLRLEWVMRPPLNYWNEMRILLEKSTLGIHEILDIPVVRKVCRCNHHCVCGRKGGQFAKNGQEVECRCKESCVCAPTIDTKLAAVKEKLHNTIEMRVKGAIIQRFNIDKRQLVAHANVVKEQANKIEAENTETAKSLPPTMEGVEEELLRLRQEVKELKGGHRLNPVEVALIDDDED